MFPHEDVGGLDVVTGTAVALTLRDHGVQPVLPVRLHLQHVETNHQLGAITEISKLFLMRPDGEFGNLASTLALSVI